MESKVRLLICLAACFCHVLSAISAEGHARIRGVRHLTQLPLPPKPPGLPPFALNAASQGPRQVSGATSQAFAQGSPQAVAQVAVAATTTGDTYANSQAVAQSFVQQSRRDSFMVAQATATASVTSAASTANVLALASAEAVTTGSISAFATSQAQAFGIARQNGQVDVLARTIAMAIQRGGSQSREAYAQAFAQAAAAGGNQAMGLAEASAIVFCEGGASAEAFAETLALSIGRDSRGCTILTETRAYAYARCGPNGAQAVAGSSSISRALGLCGFTPSPHMLFGSAPLTTASTTVGGLYLTPSLPSARG